MKKNPRKIRFHKMHSLGNDFVVLDRVSQGVDLDEHRVAAWGDRHTGIGFDQLLTIDPPTEPEADFAYGIYNTDGSQAEQCGNGTRCVTLLVRQLGLTKKSTIEWQSPAGRFTTTFVSRDHIETIMTVPELERAAIPFDESHTRPLGDNAHQFEVTTGADGAEQHYSVTPVSTGNPHAVMFFDDIFDLDVANIGAALTQHPAFPQGANIGFCQVVDPNFVRLRVFERGVGETRACGSGACAAVVAGRLLDKVSAKVKVSLPGGKLRIAWPAPDAPVTMIGSATHVYSAEI